MKLSPAAFQWLLTIDAAGTMRVDTSNGCIANLREALAIKYLHKHNGDAWRYATVTELGKSYINQNREKHSLREPGSQH